MKFSRDIFEYIEAHAEEALELLIQLAQIPAPSHREEQRAEFCLNWLKTQGGAGCVYR